MKNAILLITLSFFLFILPGMINAQKVVKIKPSKPVMVTTHSDKLIKTDAKWRIGQWKWSDHYDTYIWDPGKWVEHKNDKIFISGFWKEVERGFIWVPGYWIKVKKTVQINWSLAEL